MLRHAAFGSATVLGLAMAGSGCRSHVCTLVGCQDQVTITLHSTNGAWTPGTYTLDLAIEGASDVTDSVSCTIAIPAAPGLVTQGTCPGRTSTITLQLVQDTHCVSSPSNGSNASTTCTPIPGQFSQILTVIGTPTRLTMTVSRDGQALTTQSLALGYTAAQPNGPDCDPTCHQASATVMVAT